MYSYQQYSHTSCSLLLLLLLQTFTQNYTYTNITGGGYTDSSGLGFGWRDPTALDSGDAPDTEALTVHDPLYVPRKSIKQFVPREGLAPWRPGGFLDGGWQVNTGVSKAVAVCCACASTLC
jgi:hypothetical protein